MLGIARVGTVICLLIFACSAIAADVKPLNQWKGSIEDEKLMMGSPECIVTAKGFENLWAKWKREGKPPEVNFDKELVVITTSVGSQLNIFLKLDDKGDLMVAGMGTFDIRPGFRYVIATVPKEGVKKVNGKELPKE